MIGKKSAKMLLAGALVLVLAGCGGRELSQFPVETRAPVVVEPQTQPDVTEENGNGINMQARERAETFGYFYGIRNDGTVVLREITERNAAGDYVPVDVSHWTDIVAVVTDTDAGVVGLRSDGTLLSGGMDEGGQLDVGHWRNIKAFKIDNYTTFALQEDGTLLMTGYGDEVLWTDIRCPGE